jgi:large subunit ribosomal protein L22
MQVTAKLNNLRISPRKARIVANFIKGLDISEALNQLDAIIRKSNPLIKKLLMSAVNNAENDFGLDRDNLYVFAAIVGAGASMKRWRPRAFGRASKILKRTSQIEIILEERVEGKGRKTKEEIEKNKQRRIEEKKKQDKQIEKERKDEASEPKETEATTKTGEKMKETLKAKKTKENKGGLASRIFRRKSM